jgi:hypothetical protein
MAARSEPVPLSLRFVTVIVAMPNHSPTPTASLMTPRGG